jgi:SAM-dependent methyltransferase
VLGEIRRVLRPGGRLVIETNHRDRLALRSPAREWYPLGEGAFLLAESRVDRIAGTVEMTHTYLPVGGFPQTRTIHWRAYSVTELARMLADVGYGEVACYGTLEGGPFGPDTRLVLVATVPPTEAPRASMR